MKKSAAVIAVLLAASIGSAQAPVQFPGAYFDSLKVPSRTAQKRSLRKQNGPGRPVCRRPDPLDEKCTPLNFNGRDGFNGLDGRHGDPIFPNGFDGSRGGNGSAAPGVTLHLTITQDKTGQKFLQVQGQGGGSKYVVIFPLDMFPLKPGQRIQVLAKGGDGGRGGNGGRGFQGCAQFDPRSRRCLRWANGRDGRGGNGGNGGNGASVTVHVTPESNAYVRHFAFHVHAGPGGQGGWGMPRGVRGFSGLTGSIRIEHP